MAASDVARDDPAVGVRQRTRSVREIGARRIEHQPHRIVERDLST